MWRVLKLGTEFRHAHRCSSFVSNARSLLINVHVLGKASSPEPCTISSMASNTTASPPLSVPGQQNPVFIDHIIYKGKGALRVQPVAPVFSPLDGGTIKILREGAILLKFAPALGQWKYDWKKEQVFRLSATEIGSLLSLSPNESCEFFSDSFMGTSNAGQVTKALQITPIPNSPGYLFKLSISNESKSFDSQLTIPITKAEFAVMRTAFNFILPYMVGWHASANYIQCNKSSHIMFGKSGKKKSAIANPIKPDQEKSISFGKSKMQTSSTKNSSTSDQAASTTFEKSQIQVSCVTNTVKPDQSASFTVGKSEIQVSSDSEWSR